MGMHEVLVTNEGEAVRGAPHFLRSMPKSKKDYDGMCKIDNSYDKWFDENFENTYLAYSVYCMIISINSYENIPCGEFIF